MGMGEGRAGEGAGEGEGICTGTVRISTVLVPPSRLQLKFQLYS
jgi:hypothetical protein